MRGGTAEIMVGCRRLRAGGGRSNVSRSSIEGGTFEPRQRGPPLTPTEDETDNAVLGKWFRNLLLGVLAVTGLRAWSKGLLNEYLPSPKQVVLWLANVRRGKAQPRADRFRIVLCWLDNDRAGDNTRHVAEAFTRVEGVSLVRTARIVAAPGASEDWRNTMQKDARSVLEQWHADLAVVGLVKESGKALSLWFVPRSGEGTLRRGDESYELDNATLGPDFHDDLRAELTSVALVAVAPLAETETRGRVLENGLREATAKLATLLNKNPVDEPERRARLHLSLGNALATLGEREVSTERLEQAVVAYRAALDKPTRERVPLGWAAAQNNLGNVLQALGEREVSTERLEQAVVACRAALEEYTRDRVPLDWAATQNNLGNALQALGTRESGTAHLAQAVVAYRAALEEYTRDRVPLDWAMTQNNLGNALQLLGTREISTERLEQAVVAHRAALEERTRDRVPLDWAMTQNNLGNTLLALGVREIGNEHLEQAVVAHRAALEERTRDRVPLNWAATQNNLGNVLLALGERETGTERLEQAVVAYRAALKEYTRDQVPRHWATTRNNLSNALRALRERAASNGQTPAGSD